eukprot:CAMPEP_0171360258 /NCGR_PEP_ID=MMETSP0879-20121228/1125_1 /TAXON_ID=67004 /ORGANISM="Thalassiosira weissflogii, Strain CCMP1336" /LENGTH=514 /DNA_ID=CAMNT_0011866567 /DNA_START=998 /DNA_END=2542 /DNA_ORIENTATION=-
MYPEDWNTQRCVQDCSTINGAPCNGNPPDQAGIPVHFFDSAQACCQTKLSWVSTSDCIAQSNGATVIGSNTVTTGTGGGTLTCAVDSDCNHMCTSGFCVPVTQQQTTCACTSPKTVPNQCEMDILIDAMEVLVSHDHALIGQWTRAGFHDAGTFNQNVPEGGANGCLLNDPLMLTMPENNHFVQAIFALQAVKDFFNNHRNVCVSISSADLLQFAIFFTTTRQTGIPGLDATKRSLLKIEFEWGRPDEPNCDTDWTMNLPGFDMGGGQYPGRCTLVGAEIQEKMIRRNGFTPEEATALIGAHTIGSIRGTFGSSLAGPWVPNGHDSATLKGPIFDNAYHDFLINTIPVNACNDFATSFNPPFNRQFPTWYRTSNGLDHLDSDIVLAFPSLDTNIHDNFHVFTRAFAADNNLFITTFFQALHKMGKLGVNVALTKSPSSCTCRRRLDSATAHRRNLLEDGEYSGQLSVIEILELGYEQGDAAARAFKIETELQFTRLANITALTTPVRNSNFTKP